MTEVVGSEDQGPREVRWYLARAVPDLERNEPRNIGLVLRVAESDRLAYAFVTDPVALAARGVVEVDDCIRIVGDWIATIEKHGTRCLHWLPNRKNEKRFYIDHASHAIMPGRVNFTALYTRLVL